MPHSYKHPRPALTVDAVVFGLDLAATHLSVLLVERKRDPFKGRWAIPGGFVTPGESLEVAARRELEEETGVVVKRLEQFYTFGEPERDPREHVISVAHFTLVDIQRHPVAAGSDAGDARWFPAAAPPPLAFDHARMLGMARARLAKRVWDSALALELLPKKFSLTMLQRLYEAALDQPLDKRNFRRKIQSLGLLEKLGEAGSPGAANPVNWYRLDRRKLHKWKRSMREGLD